MVTALIQHHRCVFSKRYWLMNIFTEVMDSGPILKITELWILHILLSNDTHCHSQRLLYWVYQNYWYLSIMEWCQEIRRDVLLGEHSPPIASWPIEWSYLEAPLDLRCWPNKCLSRLWTLKVWPIKMLHQRCSLTPWRTRLTLFYNSSVSVSEWADGDLQVEPRGLLTVGYI